MLLIPGQIKTVSYYRQITHLAVSKSSTLRVIINVLSFPACNFVWKTENLLILRRKDLCEAKPL